MGAGGGGWQPEGGKLHHKCCANYSVSPLPSIGGLFLCPFCAFSLLEDGGWGGKKSKMATCARFHGTTSVALAHVEIKSDPGRPDCSPLIKSARSLFLRAAPPLDIS